MTPDPNGGPPEDTHEGNKTRSGLSRRTVLAGVGVGAWAVPTLLTVQSAGAGQPGTNLCAPDSLPPFVTVPRGTNLNGLGPVPSEQGLVDVTYVITVPPATSPARINAGINGASLQIRSPEAGEFMDVSITFSTPVDQLVVSLKDIDRVASTAPTGTWEEVAFLGASGPGGAAVPATITVGANLMGTNPWSPAVDGEVPATDPASWVVLADFSGLVDTIQLRLTQLNRDSATATAVPVALEFCVPQT